MKKTLPLFASMLLAAASANAGVASSPGEPSSTSLPPAAARPEGSPHHSRVLFDAPGHAAAEGAAVTARGGAPGASWRLVDWRGREVEGAVGAFDGRGEATLPPLPAGYYRLVGGGASRPGEPFLATLAVVAPPGGAGGTASFFAADSAASYIARGAFDCPWNGGDAIRTIADLAQLAGIRHIRERMRWSEVEPSPDAPPDFSRLLAAADLFAERGIALSGCFHDCPPWAGRLEKLPGDLGAIHRFCAETAAAFGDRMEDWEFWNEPDIGFAPEPVWDYAAALKAACLGFKSARPGMPVMNGGLCRPPASAYETQLFANGAAQYFDVFNYHTYAALSLYPAIFASQREALAAAGADDRPVWITECGTNNEGPATEPGVRPEFTAHSPGQELVVAEHCAKANVSLQMEGIARNYTFVLGAYSERGGKKDWGMLRRDGTVKPAYAALATQIRELGDATPLGRMDAPAGIRAYLYERPDGSQTVAYWAESPLDDAPSNTTLVDAEPDCAREWVLETESSTQRRGDAGANPHQSPLCDYALKAIRIADMCGGAFAAEPDESGALHLPATRYPAYVSGLHGLAAVFSTQGRREAETMDSGASAPQRLCVKKEQHVPSPIVFRVDLAPGDFAISGSKTLAVAKVDEPRLRVQVWNLSGTAATGTVAAAGAALAGLPGGTIEIEPFGKAEFDCLLKPVPPVPPVAPVAPVPSPFATLVLTGRFDGREASPLAMPVLFEPALLASCEAVELPWRDPAAWQRNDSAATYRATWDDAEQAVRFDVEWTDPKVDRWLYPVLPLPPELRGLPGAVRALFEVKSAQDKVENDFKDGGSNFMLVRTDGAGSANDYMAYPPPGGAWERRYVELSAVADTSGVEAIRLGANPLGMRLTFWVRGLALLRPAAP